MRVAILTISDSVAAGKREDRSGPALREKCAALGWPVAETRTIPDDLDVIQEHLAAIADSGSVDLLLTCGGTGIGPRDVTPEATQVIAVRLLPGIGERMRSECGRSNPRAALSRALAGVRGQALIVNLPGSPRGAVECLEAVAELLPHAVDVLRGARHD